MGRQNKSTIHLSRELALSPPRLNEAAAAPCFLDTVALFSQNALDLAVLAIQRLSDFAPKDDQDRTRTMFKVGKGKKRKTGRGIGTHEKTKFNSHGYTRKDNICSPVFSRKRKIDGISPSEPRAAVTHNEEELRNSTKAVCCRRGSPGGGAWAGPGGTTDIISSALVCRREIVTSVLK